MKLLLFLPAIRSGGAERVMVTLAEAWAQKGFEVTLATVNRREDFFNVNERVVRLRLDIPLDSRPVIGSLSSFFTKQIKIRKAILDINPDIIISFLNKLNIRVLLAAWGLKNPVIVSERIAPQKTGANLLWKLFRRILYPCSALVVAQTEREAAWFRPFVKRVMTIPNPVSSSVFLHSRTLHSVGDDLSIAAMGRLCPQKGFDLLITAFVSVRKKIPGCSLTIYGEGEFRPCLENAIREYGLETCAFLPGNSALAYQAIASSDLFVLSSRFEGFPNVLVEAMAIGIPVIAFDCPNAQREIIMPGKTGLLVNEQDVDALADAIVILLKDREMRKKFWRLFQGICSLSFRASCHSRKMGRGVSGGESMNILGIFLVQEIRTGGHTRYLELMDSIAERHSVHVIFNSLCGYQPKNFKYYAMPYAYKRNGIIPRSRFFSGIVRRVLGRGMFESGYRPDCIVIFGESHFLAADILRRRFFCPLVFAYRSVSVRESLIELGESRRKPLRFCASVVRLLVSRAYELAIARSASLVVFQSDADKQDYLMRNSSIGEKTAVIRGDVCQPRFNKKYQLSNPGMDPNRLLFIGTFGDRKGLKYLIGALIELRKRGLMPILDVLADGNALPFSANEAYKDIAHQINFHGKIKDPFPFLCKAGLLVVPSIYDSYPNVILEALHAGCPVIGSSTGGIPDMLGNSELLFESRDSVSLADKLESLLTNQGEYMKVMEMCRIRREYFVFDWAHEWISVIEPLTEANR